MKAIELKMTPKQKGILFSYLIGLPTGLTTTFIVLSVSSLLGFLVMFFISLCWQVALVSLISFLIALGIAGRNAAVDIQKQKFLLKVSFNYSLTVNAIIWTVFILIIVIYGLFFISFAWQLLIFPIIAFIFCTAITTFTIGLLICYVIKNQIHNQPNNQ